ncbi:MAG TPA: hypothetical protein VMR70_12625 [Flavisolibacter sp.]|nr:hypothetical protein [Flavisolibacter sp.]
MRFLPALFLFLIVTAFTCRKTAQKEDQYALYAYKQTQCADAWQNSTTDSITVANVAAYLASQSLPVMSLRIKADEVASVCSACQCKTGKTIYVMSSDDGVTKAKFQALGFQ